MKTKILIIEPSQIIVEGLCAILKRQSRFVALTPCENLDDIEAKVTVLKPDIVIANPTLENVASRLEALDVKAAALVYQYVQPSQLRDYDTAIDIRESAGSLIEHLVGLAELNGVEGKGHKTVSYDLTKRETAVLVEVAQGLTNKEIAEKMSVSVHTVISHRKNIMHKTGIKSVAGLTVYAMLHNLVKE